MSDYYLLITDAGKALEAAAHASGEPVKLTDFAVGDGGGAVVTPDASQTALVNETFRDAISSLTVSPTDTAVLEAECIIPKSSGGYTIREIGILADDGTLYAVGNFAEQEKPAPDSGYAASLQVFADLVVSDTSDITLIVQDGSYLTETQGNTIYLRQDKRLSEIADQGATAQQEAREHLGLKSAATHDVTTSSYDTTAGRVLKAADYGWGTATGLASLNSIFDITCTAKYSALGVGAGASATEGMPANSGNTRFSVESESIYTDQYWVTIRSTSQTYVGLVHTANKTASWTQYYSELHKPAAVDVDAVSASQGGVFQKQVQFSQGLRLQNAEYLAGIEYGSDAASFTGANLLLKSWYGIGFYSNYPDSGELGIMGYMNVRLGRLEMKEQIIPGNYGNFDARYQKINTASKAGNGWFKDTNTGLIIQFGHGSHAKDSRITFPIAFPNACIGPVGNDSGTGLVGVSLGAFDKTGFTMYAEEGSVSLSWIAIGY